MSVRPSRQLFSALVEILESQDELQRCLSANSEFNRMKGELKPRFTEWVYSLLETRELASNLRNCLRPTDIDRLAASFQIPPDDLEGLDDIARTSAVLKAIGLAEPTVPRLSHDGTAEIREFERRLRMFIESGVQLRKPDAAAARRGCERLLKYITHFARAGGGGELLCEVAEQGLHGFHAFEGPVSPNDSTWFSKFDITKLNHLLSSFEAHRKEVGLSLPFLPEKTPFWSRTAYGCVAGFNDALNFEVHDKLPQGNEHSPGRLLGAAAKVVAALDAREIPVPRPVRLFRKYHDGAAQHYEGYTRLRTVDQEGEHTEPRLVRFYEMSDDLSLHKDYVFLAATNPSAVDAVCVPLDQAFLNPVKR